MTEPVGLDGFRMLMLLQVGGGTFPTGWFHHSMGLETAVQQGRVRDGETLFGWICDYLSMGLATADGAATFHACRCAVEADLETALLLDREIGALKLTQEGRQASLQTGRAFLRAARLAFPHPFLEAYAQGVAAHEGGHLATAFGATGGAWKLPPWEVTLTFLFGAAAGLVSAGTRLFALGALEAQRILAALHPHLVDATERASATPPGSLHAFTPLADVDGMQHEHLESRLFLS